MTTGTKDDLATQIANEFRRQRKPSFGCQLHCIDCANVHMDLKRQTQPYAPDRPYDTLQIGDVTLFLEPVQTQRLYEMVGALLAKEAAPDVTN